MIDPTFYTAYSQHPGDLLQRFGEANYYWVRLGFVLPAAVFHALLGPIPGFVAFRYVLALLAVVSGYVVCRRLLSRPAAWCFVAVITTNPVVLTAWGSDYPDSAALSYLVAAAACLAMPIDGRPRLRHALRLLGGAFLGLAVNSHLAALPLLVAMIVAVVVAHRGRERWVDAVSTVVGAVLVTAGLALLAEILWGAGDIITPSVNQYLRLQRPEQIAVWHSATWEWIQRATYLLVPIMLLIGWVIAFLRNRTSLSRPESFLVTAATLSVGAAVWSQARGGASLEYFLYSSLLWWSVGYLTAICAWRLTSSGRTTSYRRWVPSVLVVLVTIVSAWLSPPVWRFSVWPDGVALVVGCALGGLALVAIDRRSTARGRNPLAAPGFMIMLLVVATVLTVGQPAAVYAPGQARYPQVDFSAVSRIDTGRVRNVYRVISEIPAIVPADGKPVLPWAAGGRGFPGPPLDAVAQSAAQYPASSLASTMPVVTVSDAARLDRVVPDAYVLLLSETSTEFSAAENALAPWRPEVVTRRTIRAGDVELHVELLRLTK